MLPRINSKIGINSLSKSKLSETAKTYSKALILEHKIGAALKYIHKLNRLGKKEFSKART